MQYKSSCFACKMQEKKGLLLAPSICYHVSANNIIKCGQSLPKDISNYGADPKEATAEEWRQENLAQTQFPSLVRLDTVTGKVQIERLEDT